MEPIKYYCVTFLLEVTNELRELRYLLTDHVIEELHLQLYESPSPFVSFVADGFFSNDGLLYGERSIVLDEMRIVAMEYVEYDESTISESEGQEITAASA